MRRFRTQPLDLPADREEISRADLVFYGVDHSGPSYEARIFLDTARANAETPRDIEKGYAGSFTVFGHGGCYGDEGHCAPNDRTSDEFDVRPAHPLTPQTRSVTITDALKRTTGDQVTVYVVALPRESRDGPASTDIAAFERVRLVTYQD
jgi:tyrosinase